MLRNIRQNDAKKIVYVFKYSYYCITRIFKMVVHCELYLCNINRLDIPEEVHLTWISQSTEYSNFMSSLSR